MHSKARVRSVRIAGVSRSSTVLMRSASWWIRRCAVGTDATGLTRPVATNGLVRVMSSRQLAPAFSAMARERSTAPAVWVTVDAVSPASAVSRVSVTDSAVAVSASKSVPALGHTERSVEMSMRGLVVLRCERDPVLSMILASGPWILAGQGHFHHFFRRRFRHPDELSGLEHWPRGIGG